MASWFRSNPDKTLIEWRYEAYATPDHPVVWGFVAWKRIFGHTDKVNCVAKIDGGCFVSGSSDYRLIDGGCFVSGSSDNTLIVWALSLDYDELGVEYAASQILTGHTSAVMCVAQLDGRRLVSGSGDKTLIVWVKGDDGMFAAAQTLAGHTESVRCMMQHCRQAPFLPTPSAAAATRWRCRRRRRVASAARTALASSARKFPRAAICETESCC